MDDDSDDDGSNSGSSVTYSFCAFYLRLTDSIESVSGMGSGVFVPTGVDSKCDIFYLSFLYQLESSRKVVDSMKNFGAQIPYFFQI